MLYLLTSKRDLSEQLQRRSEAGDAKLDELKTRRDALERERSNAQYGYHTDPQETEKITNAQRALNETYDALRPAAAAIGLGVAAAAVAGAAALAFGAGPSAPPARRDSQRRR